MASLFFILYIPIEAFSIAQSQIRIGIYSKGVHQGLIEALKHQNRPGGRRDPSIFRNFSTWKFSKIPDMDKKILKDPSLETLLFCCRMTSRRLPRISRILGALCVEISTLVLNFGSSYTKSSYGPLVSAILNVSICPSDMLWQMLPATFSATLEKDLVRIHKEIKLSVNFLCWGIFSEIRPHKVGFLKIEKSD